VHGNIRKDKTRNKSDNFIRKLKRLEERSGLASVCVCVHGNIRKDKTRNKSDNLIRKLKRLEERSGLASVRLVRLRVSD
jgi:BMFP domain-containing protein YqiC